MKFHNTLDDIHSLQLMFENQHGLRNMIIVGYLYPSNLSRILSLKEVQPPKATWLPVMFTISELAGPPVS